MLRMSTKSGKARCMDMIPKTVLLGCAGLQSLVKSVSTFQSKRFSCVPARGRCGARVGEYVLYCTWYLLLCYSLFTTLGSPVLLCTRTVPGTRTVQYSYSCTVRTLQHLRRDLRRSILSQQKTRQQHNNTTTTPHP